MKQIPISYLIKFYKLEPYFKQLILENKGNTNPYHNLQHTLTVMMYCLEIGAYEGLEYDDLRTLLLASIYHDFDYKPLVKFTNGEGYEESEILNVRNAVRIATAALKDEPRIHEIIKLISSTLNTSTPGFTYDGVLEKVLHDADRLGWTANSYLQDILINYFDAENGTSMSDGIDKEISFIRNLKLLTSRGKEIYMTHIDIKLQELNYLKKLIK